MARPDLKVGSPVWVFSSDDTPEIECIASETSRSWVVSNGTKVPKSLTADVYDVNPGFGCTRRHCLTRSAADAMLLERSKWAMINRLKECSDPAALRTIAAALGLPASVEDA